MTALPNKRHKVTEKDQRPPGKIKIRGQQVSSTAGGRRKRQHRTELDGVKWSVAYVPPGATRHKQATIVRHVSLNVTRCRTRRLRLWTLENILAQCLHIVRPSALPCGLKIGTPVTPAAGNIHTGTDGRTDRPTRRVIWLIRTAA